MNEEEKMQVAKQMSSQERDEKMSAATKGIIGKTNLWIRN
jgi:hypothetical protein